LLIVEKNTSTGNGQYLHIPPHWSKSILAPFIISCYIAK
jgi:hypothetical protein